MIVSETFMLVALKIIHTLIWAVMAGSIVAMPFLALRRRFAWVARLSALVFAECLVLAVNGGRCPLTDMAARYTTDRAANFDIYLPLWLAEHNKTIFGILFIAGELVVAWSWLRNLRDGRPMDNATPSP